MRFSALGSKLVRFHCLFLGKSDELVEIMEEKFPELGLSLRDCSEMSWDEFHSIQL